MKLKKVVKRLELLSFGESAFTKFTFKQFTLMMNYFIVNFSVLA